MTDDINNDNTDNINQDNIMDIVETDKSIIWVPPPSNKMIAAGIKRKRQRVFLDALSQSGSMTKAGRIAGINPETARSWLNSTDTWYQTRFKDAMQAYRDSIHEEVHSRAVDGVEVPIIGKKQVQVGQMPDGRPIFAPEDVIIGTKIVKSDLLLMFHAKKVDHGYRDKIENDDKGDKPMETISPIIRLTVKLDTMQQRKNVPLLPQKSESPDTDDDGTIDAEFTDDDKD